MKKINSIEVRRKINLGNYETADLGVVISVDENEVGEYLDIIEETTIETYHKLYELRKMALRWIDEGQTIEQVKLGIEDMKKKLLEEKKKEENKNE
jgi:hypothetical protein|tara:strand:- start:39889 stop:40176 length:288 start_codon:yes stop_codon:yes gene_type:complete